MHEAGTDPRALRREHTVRRLETFSDIVIAFTLSELALVLRLPQHTRDLLTHPINLFFFLASFALVCSLWWLHHRLFARCFYPDTISVLMNFAFLASTVYVTYSFLLITTFSDVIALSAYAVSIGFAYSLIALLFAKGLRDPRIKLDEIERRYNAHLASRVGVAGVGSLVAAMFGILGRGQGEILAVWIALAVLLAFIGIRQRLARRRRERGQGDSSTAS